MKEGRFRSFFTGALVGVGLGILLAPKEGNEIQDDLKKTFSLLVDTIKNVDVEETKANFLKKVKEIRDELSTIDTVTAREAALEKVALIEDKCTELIVAAQEQELPVVQKAATKILENTRMLLDEFLCELNEVFEQEIVSEKEEVIGHKKKENNKKDLPKRKKSSRSRKS